MPQSSYGNRSYTNDPLPLADPGDLGEGGGRGRGTDPLLGVPAEDRAPIREGERVGAEVEAWSELLRTWNLD